MGCGLPTRQRVRRSRKTQLRSVWRRGARMAALPARASRCQPLGERRPVRRPRPTDLHPNRQRWRAIVDSGRQQRHTGSEGRPGRAVPSVSAVRFRSRSPGIRSRAVDRQVGRARTRRVSGNPGGERTVPRPYATTPGRALIRFEELDQPNSSIRSCVDYFPFLSFLAARFSFRFFWAAFLEALPPPLSLLAMRGI